MSKWLQSAVQKSSHVGSGIFGISGANRSFKPGLSAPSAAIQAISDQSGLIILHAGGDKNTQAKAIKSAQVFARNFKEDE